MTERKGDGVTDDTAAFTSVLYREERVATPMPPSLRRSYKGQSKRSKSQRARKGIPPWKLR